MTDVQQKQENPLHTVRQGRYQGQDIYVYANSFNAADAWFAKCLRTGNTDFKNMENEIKDENTVYVDKIVVYQCREAVAAMYVHALRNRAEAMRCVEVTAVLHVVLKAPV